MRNADENRLDSAPESTPTLRIESRRDRPRMCPSPGECRLMAGLVLSLAGIAVLALGNSAIAGTVPWMEGAGCSALITGLLMWSAGALQRTLEL